jgi:hypothetical protein
MGIYSGALGAINGIANVRNWSVDDVSDPKSAVSSATRRGTARKAGVKSWSGSFSTYGSGVPPYMPGDIFTFVGYRNATTDVRNTAGIRTSGDVIIDSMQINWNWSAAEIISTVYNFSGDGAVAHASGAGVIDATVGAHETPVGTQVVADAVTLPDVSTVSFNLTIQNQSYVSSGTSNWTKRKRGTGIDFTVAITQFNEAGIAPVAIGVDSVLNLYTNATQFWILKWCQLASITGVTVDIETGAIIQQTLNYNMNGISAGALGQIRVPGAIVDWWPATP